MPLRTNRGRSAVYRRLWGWPLRSKAHLAAAISGLVAAGVILAATASLQAPGQQTQRPPSPPATTHHSAPPAVSTSVTPPTTVGAGAPPEALHVATEFGQRWVSRPPGMTAQQLTAQLQPVAEPELLLTLQSVDPVRIHDTRLVGQPRSTEVRPAVVTVDVPTDATVLHLTVVRTPAGWRVHHMETA